MPDQAAETLHFQVTREPGFARFYADNAATFSVGPDIEMSFTVTTPILSSVDTDGEIGGNTLSLEAAFVELCRIRMNKTGAVAAAFNLIFGLLRAGKLDVDHLRTNIEEMISSLESLPEDEIDAN
jgi:hypothetical protein